MRGSTPVLYTYIYMHPLPHFFPIFFFLIMHRLLFLIIALVLVPLTTLSSFRGVLRTLLVEDVIDYKEMKAIEARVVRIPECGEYGWFNKYTDGSWKIIIPSCLSGGGADFLFFHEL
jgi:hypothetical protein